MAVNPNSHIIAVTGGKGGVGKSVFSRQPCLRLSHGDEGADSTD